MPVILRSEKGSPLNEADGDGNFTVVRNLENTVVQATEGQAGIVELAGDGESAAGLAVQANDGRLLGEAGSPQEGDLYRMESGVFVPYGPKAITVSLTADQTAVAEGSRVEFDQVTDTSGHIVLDTVTNPGVLSLPAGRYFFIASCFAQFSQTGSSLGSLYWMPVGGVWPDDFIGGGGNGIRPPGNNTTIAASEVLIATGNFAAPTDVELRIITNDFMTAIGLNTTATIFSIP